MGGSVQVPSRNARHGVSDPLGLASKIGRLGGALVGEFRFKSWYADKWFFCYRKMLMTPLFDLEFLPPRGNYTVAG